MIVGPALVLMFSAVVFSIAQLATRELSDTPELYRAYCASAGLKMGCTSCEGCDEGGGAGADGDGGCCGGGGGCVKCCGGTRPRGVRPVEVAAGTGGGASDWSHAPSASQHVPPAAVVAEKG